MVSKHIAHVLCVDICVDSYVLLHNAEKKALVSRLAAAKASLKNAEEFENAMQDRYADLKEKIALKKASSVSVQ